VIFTAELFGSTYTDDPFKTRTTPFEGMLGARAVAWRDFRAGASMGIGLARGYGTPTVRGVLAVEWAPAMPLPPAIELDRDHDGVIDAHDACPNLPGEATRDPKTNGCPTKTDRDKDGIDDDHDVCPNAPGPRTEDPRTNGCPTDRDGDGVIDPVDACPDVPGVAQENPKKAGCPRDSDDDGIVDEEDWCPDVPGITSSDPKLNGCPDPDRDKDGVTNDVDACPDEPGMRDPDPKKNGCPKAFVQKGQIRITDQVRFQVGGAAIEKGKDSEEILEAVRKVLGDHPEIKKVRIEGHTDSQGGAVFNKKLSADRAASVVQWLVAHGVEASRLTSEGFGQDSPLDTNATDAGRKNNRRVEFHIEE
jgi:outer membrane protein OmpA-like peptidoglycan-associated protein